MDGKTATMLRKILTTFLLDFMLFCESSNFSIRNSIKFNSDYFMRAITTLIKASFATLCYLKSFCNRIEYQILLSTLLVGLLFELPSYHESARKALRIKSNKTQQDSVSLKLRYKKPYLLFKKRENFL